MPAIVGIVNVNAITSSAVFNIGDVFVFHQFQHLKHSQVQDHLTPVKRYMFITIKAIPTRTIRILLTSQIVLMFNSMPASFRWRAYMKYLTNVGEYA